MNLDNIGISELYKDHLKYEFKSNELHKLLGESIESSRPDRRYFLKFSGLQVVNVDYSHCWLILHWPEQYFVP